MEEYKVTFSIGSDLGLSRVNSDTLQPVSDRVNSSDKTVVKHDNHDSGRSVSPPPRRLFSREGSVESSGQFRSS